MQLTVLSTSDIHGYFTAENYANPSQKLKGGLSRVAKVIEEEQATRLDPMLYIDNGDLIQGSPLARLYHKQKVAKKLTAGIDALDVDAFSLGNHEFNYGKDFLEKVMYSASFLTVCGNVLINNKPAFGPAFITKKFGPLKVGILGLVTPRVVDWEDPSHIRGLTFVSALEAAQRWVPILKDQEKCDLVIVAYHDGFEKNPYTAEDYGDVEGENEAYALLDSGLAIDLLITAHQHQMIADVINGIAVVQSGYQGEAVAKTVFDISRGPDNEIVAQVASCENVITAAYEESQTILDIYQKDVDYVKKQLDRTIGQSQGQLKLTDVLEAQVNSHPYIDLINHIQTQALDADVSCTSLVSEDVQGLDSTISLGQVLAHFPFPNKLCKLRVSGQELRDILEYNAAYFDLNEEGQVVVADDYLHPKKQIYHYDLFSGIDYAYDVSQPRGQRLVKLDFQGRALDSDQELSLAVNSFRAHGGGGFPHYGSDKIEFTHESDLSDLVIDYIKNNSPILP